MENPRYEEEKIIEDIRNLFRLKKEQNDTAIKDVMNRFRLKRNKRKELNIEYLEILGIFLSIKKKKKTILNQ